MINDMGGDDSADFLTNERKIANVQRWQAASWMHPLTCGNDSGHANLEPVERDGKVVLICKDCPYVQEWIPTCCLHGPPPDPFEGTAFAKPYVCEHGVENCCMPSEHLESECHTPEMVEAFNEEVKMTQPQPQQQQPGKDMLSDLFEMQEQLNNKTFAKCGFKDPEGLPLTIARIQEDVKNEKIGPNDLPNTWLLKYLTADDAESKELREALLWKFWSKDKIDLQNIRVEIIDKLHFLISLAQAAGLTAGEFHRLYMAKHEVNNKRQDTGYSQATKTEEDNKTVV